MGDQGEKLGQASGEEREGALEQFKAWAETPMVVLAFTWFALFIDGLVEGTSPLADFFGTLIWVVFIAETLTEIVLAPDKKAYLRSNWVIVISLFVPAFRIFRILRIFQVANLARAVQGIRLLSVITSLNRTMHALRVAMKKGGFGYVLMSTVIVVLGGAAGMLLFENGVAGPDKGLHTYGDALWWTAMIMTTMGSEYWPRTGEGRILCFLLALYAFSVFGYVTAFIATLLIGREEGKR